VPPDFYAQVVQEGRFTAEPNPANPAYTDLTIFPAYHHATAPAELSVLGVFTAADFTFDGSTLALF